MNEIADNYWRSSLNGFSTGFIDRSHSRRNDEGWLRERLRDPSARFVTVWNSSLLFTGEATPHPALLSRDDLEQAGLEPRSSIFLGVDGDIPYFALDITGNGPKPPAAISRFGRFSDLRTVGALLDSRETGLLTYAKTMTHWHSRSRFCGDCGSPTLPAAGGHVRVCSNKDCAKEHFPRTDPAIIVLVTSGDSCLLGRQAIWPKFRYSIIAGFVEPGENIEDAVVREVLEEAGVHVREVRYHSSQPWPFPCSLMLGFTAKADRERIALRDRELEDAKWMSRSEMKNAIERGELLLPNTISISYHLLEDWFDSGGTIRLKDLKSAA